MILRKHQLPDDRTEGQRSPEPKTLDELQIKSHSVEKKVLCGKKKHSLREANEKEGRTSSMKEPGQSRRNSEQDRCVHRRSEDGGGENENP